MKLKSPASIDVMMLSVVTIWGMNFAIVKAVYAYFDPIAFNALRFFVTSVTMVLLLILCRLPLRVEVRDLPALFGLGILSTTVYQFCFIIGLAHTRAGNAGLILSLTPIFAYLVGLLLKRERFEQKVMGGILLTIAGATLVILLGGGKAEFAGSWKGDLLLVGSSLCWGFFTGSAARLIHKYGALRLTVWTILTGTVFLVPLSLPWVWNQDWISVPRAGWLAFAYSTFLAIVFCYFVWSYALRQLGVARTAIYSNLIPIISLLGAWALLGEVPSIAQWVGVTLILTGILIVRMHRPIPAVSGLAK